MHRTLTAFRCSRSATSSSSSTSTRRLYLDSNNIAITQPRWTDRIYLSSFAPSFIRHFSTDHHHMSSLPTKPNVSFSIRPESLKAATTVSTSNSTTTHSAHPAPSLLSRISHSLPPKPAFTPIDTRPRSPVYRSEERRYDGSYEARGSDHYRPRSPTPERRFDTYRPISPPRKDWDRTDSYTTRSTSPPPRYRTHERSISPVKRRESPVKELPKTFFTHAHKKAEDAAAKATVRREGSEAARRDKEDARTAARAEKEREAKEYNQLVSRKASSTRLTIQSQHLETTSIISFGLSATRTKGRQINSYRSSR